MKKCPYHRSDFCTHGSQTVLKPGYCLDHLLFDCTHPAHAEPAPEVVRCDCGKRASATVTYLPRPLPLFGQAVVVSVCPSCYPDTIKKGQILKQDTFLLPE